jgi:glutamate racemase
MVNAEYLKKQLHEFSQDREIDYTSAKELVEALGGKWRAQSELMQYKTMADDYLRTFQQDKFDKVLKATRILCNEKV